MTRLLSRAALAAVLALGLLPGARAADPQPGAAPDFFFKPNDRIVFLGDSITAQYQYSTYIELYLTTRMPKGNFTFLNAGIGGDTANGGANRFQSHVLAERPTAITINFGMNDGGYGAFNPQGNKVFVEKTAAMLDMANKAGARVALLSPNAVDRRNKSNGKQYVETQKQFYAPLKGLAEGHKVAFVDQYARTRAATDKMEADDPAAKKAVPYYDGFHTSPPGGLLMAHAILTGLNAPALVSDAQFTLGADGQVTAAPKGCTLTGEKFENGALTFTRTDTALPLPVQKDWLPMLPYTNGLKDLNDYGLTVKNLKDGQYVVTVDGVAVGTYTAKELGAGVNLGTLTAGPIWEQGTKVLQAINAKNQLVAQRFFDVVMFSFPNKEWLKDLAGPAAERRAAELKTRMEKIDAAQAEIYKLALPVARKFEVRPVN